MKQATSIVSAIVGALVAAVAWSVWANAKVAPVNAYAELGLLTDVFAHIKQSYVEQVDDATLVEGAIKGMLATLDPHTSYLPADLYQDMQADTKGEFEGLGIEISKRDGFVTVVAPIEGTPASRAGIRAADQIVAVCPDATEESCKSTRDMDLTEAVRLMRGKRGTQILIQVLRGGWAGPRPFTIRRDSIQVTSVETHLIEGGLAYVRLKQFAERAAADISAGLAEIREENGEDITGVVLDLRDNPGGLLDQAVAVADLFLSDGVIVTSEGREGRERGEWRARAETTEIFEPLVVLVNGGSASASEIVAGAVQDHKRGLVLGTETFGKGSVQTIIPLERGRAGLRLTTQLYYLPTGRSIQEVRIQPDILVDPLSAEELEARNNARRGERTFGEDDLEGHLRSQGAATPGEPLEAETSSAVEPEVPLTREEAFARQLTEDNQLMQAIGYLKSIELLANLRTPEKSN